MDRSNFQKNALIEIEQAIRLAELNSDYLLRVNQRRGSALRAVFSQRLPLAALRATHWANLFRPAGYRTICSSCAR